jgi:NADPH-dependent 2,4-dienoyl-CoA reductase/sulfur reductase-like enzyme
LRKPGYWEARGIELLLGRRVLSLVTANRAVRTSRGELMPFDDLVLATGARPRRLPNQVPAGVHELRTLADARALREELAPGVRLIVIGGGFVGAEVASTAHSLGAEVTIVESARAPVARVLGNSVGRLLAQRWRAHGIDVRLNTGVATFRADAAGRIASVLLTDGTEKRADVVLVGIGIEPARDLLPERPTTFIHPAGDVVGPGHWTAAALDGVAAALRILQLPPAQPAAPYVWSDQFGQRLQVVGDPYPDDPFQLDGDDDSFSARYLDHQGRTRAALFANRPTEAAALRRQLAEAALPCAA